MNSQVLQDLAKGSDDDEFRILLSKILQATSERDGIDSKH